MKKFFAFIFVLNVLFMMQNAYAQTVFQLRKTSVDARNGTITVNDTDEGIVITGTVLGNTPQWPQSPNELALKDHVEIWLADAEPIKFPVVGWANQFGEKRLYFPQDCERLALKAQNACKEWYRKQVKYRSFLIKTFVRQWQIAPDVVEETFATPALDVLNKYEKETSSLKPNAKPIIHYFKNTETSGYQFEVLIPWNAFPPVRRLTLQRMRLAVDIFSPRKNRSQYDVYSSSTPAHLYGDPNSFTLYQFKNARHYFITPHSHPTIYYLPQPTLQIQKAIVLLNKAKDYQDEPDANSYSPTPLEIYFK